MKKPLFFQRSVLIHKAVMIQCLNDSGEPIKNAYATGFILREKDGIYLYTCWHVVTNIKMHNPTMPTEEKRMGLRISKIKANKQETGSKLTAFVLNGPENIDIPLYEKLGTSLHPRWRQDPIEDLNGAIIPIPDKHDAVKIQLPETLQFSDVQVIEQEELWKNLVFPGDRIYVVGYPYQFSSSGWDQPSPIVLTRFVASTSIQGRYREILLDGVGAPGMSGSPVFLERDDQIYLLGLYQGLIYTAGENNKYKEVGALSTCVDMTLCWTHEIAALREMPR